MWVLAFETLLNFRKGDGEGETEEGEETKSIAEKLREKERELLDKIEEVGLYRSKKKTKKGKGRKEVDDGDTGDELELQGEQQENLLAEEEKHGHTDEEEEAPVPSSEIEELDPSKLPEGPKKQTYDFSDVA